MSTKRPHDDDGGDSDTDTDTDVAHAAKRPCRVSSPSSCGCASPLEDALAVAIDHARATDVQRAEHLADLAHMDGLVGDAEARLRENLAADQLIVDEYKEERADITNEWLAGRAKRRCERAILYLLRACMDQSARVLTLVGDQEWQSLCAHAKTNMAIPDLGQLLCREPSFVRVGYIVERAHDQPAPYGPYYAVLGGEDVSGRVSCLMGGALPYDPAAAGCVVPEDAPYRNEQLVPIRLATVWRASEAEVCEEAEGMVAAGKVVVAVDADHERSTTSAILNVAVFVMRRRSIPE
jgi:hypothetical protein